MAPPIAIVCALEWELAHARSAVGGGAQDAPNVYLADLGSYPLVLAYSGMGMVGAACAAEAVIARYSPWAMLNYGCAGAHRADLLLGDIVVGTQLVAYDNLRETADGACRYNGMYYLAGGEQRRVDALEADPDLLESARRVAEEHVDQHEPWPADLGWPETVEHRSPRVVFGTVISADRWNRSPGSIGALVEQHDSLCEDMEAAAMGLVCASHGVPFLTIKDISNNELLRATSGGQAMMEELGVDQIARRAAAFTLEVVRAFATATL
jgi:adenosylhomocysteine nucleosidase